MMTLIKKDLYFLLLIITVLNCSSFISAQGVTHKLKPVDDTYIYSDNTVRGMEYTLNTYHSTAGSQYRRITFLKFDISGLSPYIQSVKLRLYCNGFSSGGDNAHQFDLYPVLLNTWAEDDVSFNNYLEKIGADVTSPLLASYVVGAGLALTPQYVELSGTALTQIIVDSINAGKQFISFRLREKNVVKKSSSAVIVEFHSKENPSGFAPELEISEKDIELLKAADIKVNNTTINNFSENTYKYIYQLPWNETVVPTVTATAKYSDGTSVSVIQASSLSGTVAESTAKINLQRATDVLTYSVVFQLLPPPTDPRISQIMIDGKPVEFFDKDKSNYTVYLPYNTVNVPAVTSLTYDPNASVQIVNATEIGEEKTIESRTARITGTSANGQQSKVYTVVFEKLPFLDIILAIGQSNMSGRAPYADATAPMDSVYLLTPAGEMEISSNPMNKYSNIRKDLSVEAMGPSYTCALKLRNTLKKQIGFVVNAQGGSSITVWYGPGKSNYDAALTRAKQIQRFGKIKAIIWHQGSADNSAGLLDNFVSYKSKLSAMVQNFRTDLNEPEMLFVCGELAERAEFDQFSSIVVQPVASYIPNSDYVVTDGTTLLSDGIHFDEPSVKLMGDRYADKVIQHIYSNTTATKELKKNEFPEIYSRHQGISILNSEFESKIKITNISGKLIASCELNPAQSEFIKLKQGMYIVTCIQNSKNQSLKLIVND